MKVVKSRMLTNTFTNLTNAIRAIRGFIRADLRGFSLIEMTIVMSIMAVLSALLLSYNHSSDNQIVLGVEQAKVAGFLNRAKAFALERKSVAGTGNVCAFGVHFDKNAGAMTLFGATTDGSGDCSPVFGGTGIENLALDNRVEFQKFTCGSCGGNAVSYDAAFEFPYLTAINPGSVTIGIKNGTVAKVVEIGTGGEIAIP